LAGIAPSVFHPSGKYAYGQSNGIDQYKVDHATGALTANGPTITGVSELALDPSGKFGLVFSGFDTVSLYNVGSNGQFTLGSSLALDQNSLAQKMAVTRH